MSSRKRTYQQFVQKDQKVGKRLKYRYGFASAFCGAGSGSGLLMLLGSALSLLDQLLTEQPKKKRVTENKFILSSAENSDWVISAEDKINENETWTGQSVFHQSLCCAVSLLQIMQC